MNTEEIKELEKQVNKLKFIASQRGGELHDLVEDRLLLEFEDLVPYAEKTFEACKAWSDLNKKLQEVKK
jgi:hypothetical protein